MMAQHTHSHSKEQPAQTEGRMIRWAPYYDLMVNITSLGHAGMLRRMTVDNAQIQPGDSVLDVGCGTGEVALLAKTSTKAGKVFGIDPAPEMITVARSKAARKKLDVDFRVGMIEALPFPDASMDVVTSSLMMHHLTEDLQVRGLAEVYRVLKPGGRLLIADFMQPTGSLMNHIFTTVTHHQHVRSGLADEITILLKKTGFSQVEQLNGNVLVIGFVRAVK
jgi:demethylmenaquinone methyltransferase/2-methoxy-6-polyprenyl-1,4-benzoquinol methylase/phosphoethanolamine N-methyltransferase